MEILNFTCFAIEDVIKVSLIASFSYFTFFLIKTFMTQHFSIDIKKCILFLHNHGLKPLYDKNFESGMIFYLTSAYPR